MLYPFFLVLLLLTACVSPGPEHKPAQMVRVQDFGLNEVVPITVTIPWWKDLGDPVLNDIIELALKDQPGLKAANARVERMMALAEINKLSLSPQLSANAEVSRQRFSERGFYPPPLAGHVYDVGTLQTGMSWSLDAQGQHTAEIASALNQVQSAQAEVLASSLFLATQISRTYIGLAKLAEQQLLIKDALHQREQVLSLTKQRVGAGLDTQLELLQAEAGLQEAQSQVEVVNELINIARHQLSALCGQSPQAFENLLPNFSQIHIGQVPTHIGADLLSRRADVTAARWRVEAATQDVKVAHTQFFPNVNIGAFIGVNSIGLNHLLEGGSLQAGVTPAIHLPIFNANTIRAQLKGKQGELDVAISQYNAAVLDALKEASDALSSSQSISRQQIDQAHALSLAKSVYQINVDRFKAGLTNQLSVLQAQSQWFAQRRLALELTAREMDNHVLLMKALGGGWSQTP